MPFRTESTLEFWGCSYWWLWAVLHSVLLAATAIALARLAMLRSGACWGLQATQFLLESGDARILCCISGRCSMPARCKHSCCHRDSWDKLLCLVCLESAKWASDP